MAVTVQMPFASAVTEISQDAFVGSSRENGTTILPFALRQHDVQQELGTQARRCWRQASSHVDVPALSPCHKPMRYRCICAQGSSVDGQNPRRAFPPALQGVSPSQHMRTSVIRVACSLAVVCGVSRRHLALLFAALFLMPMTQSSMKRWSDDIGAHWPPPAHLLQHLLVLAPATACHRDGDSPLGTHHGVMVGKDAHDRILITQEAASEHGEEARQCLQRGKDLGLKVTVACSDDAHSFPEALNAVSPHARFHADHFHTVKPIWGHRKKSLRSSRRQIKARGAEKKDGHLLACATQLGKWRWSLLQKPGNVSGAEKQALAELERDDAGFVHRCRSLIRQLVRLFAHTHSAAPATLRLHQLSQDSAVLEDRHRAKIPQCFDAHWEHALRYLRTKGMGTHRRGANAAAGMRLLRRREKNHAGLRSATTRQHDMQIYQALTYLSLDVADFLEKGPQLTELPDG